MKRKKYFYLLLLFIPLVCCFFVFNNTYAYVQLEWSLDGGTASRLNPSSTPVGSATTSWELYDALSQSDTFLLNNPWLYAPTYYQVVGKSGNYLSVKADYWFAWQGDGTSYINSARNIMTQANLRCAVGDSLASYDSTYAPQISNYSVTWQGPYSVGSTSPLSYRVHIQYNYTQQLSSSKGPNVNVYCGWNRSPSNGLFYQGLNLVEENKMAVAAQDFGTSVNLYSSLSDTLLQQQINQNNTVIDQNNQIISELQDQSSQQQEQYDQEKQEEAEREEEQKAQEEEMSSLFAFSIANPLTPFFALFGTGGDCASIPTIAGMVGSDDTQYCPWFSASTRNILTPVIGLSASMLLFGFVMSWLRSTRDTGVAV